MNVPGLPPCNDSNMYIGMTRNLEEEVVIRNQTFVYFAKQVKIAKHLELKHKNEEDVKKLLI